MKPLTVHWYCQAWRVEYCKCRNFSLCHSDSLSSTPATNTENLSKFEFPNVLLAVSLFLSKVTSVWKVNYQVYFFLSHREFDVTIFRAQGKSLQKSRNIVKETAEKKLDEWWVRQTPTNQSVKFTKAYSDRWPTTENKMKYLCFNAQI